ncbi:hypothetical protein BO94DRAFT_245068 [Aspergillus sclerotioniger CBS 115572]|uniref:Uncharacterized protein n=1 Tax=Aspergillus sclerotioniger CBS 115572 TaxID=1450535 RepID=A0A317VGA9_9EURO|nr:hypothetical protein BO94DRAFT_245068 [Aspergillus sclerotioniger CBS 115572]PWY72469.1 hypothetical protein BO94DRAFT_245068 [Aspergillus sclerotioniger CBS 115572]
MEFGVWMDRCEVESRLSIRSNQTTIRPYTVAPTRASSVVQQRAADRYLQPVLPPPRTLHSTGQEGDQQRTMAAELPSPVVAMRASKMGQPARWKDQESLPMLSRLRIMKELRAGGREAGSGSTGSSKRQEGTREDSRGIPSGAWIQTGDPWVALMEKPAQIL